MQVKLADFKTWFLQLRERRWKRWLWLSPALLAVVLALFPFDWLDEVWPAYAVVFRIVFATALAHEIGHATVFLLAGLLVLLSFPGLRRRPVLYLVVMVLGALSQEALQSLFKQSLPDIWDGRDLLLDLVGFALAYGLMALFSLRLLFQINKDRFSHAKRQ